MQILMATWKIIARIIFGVFDVIAIITGVTWMINNKKKRIS